MKKIWNNQWIYGSIMALFAVLIADYYNRINIKYIFNFILSLLVDFFTLEIKLWWLIIGLSIVALGIRILLYNSNQNLPKSSSVPEFCSYKSDFLKGYSWSWGWNFNSIQRHWVITNLKVDCPKCQTHMISAGHDFFDGYRYDCPRCNHKFSDREISEEKIELIILDNLRRNKI